jgi:hypothetical protein
MSALVSQPRILTANAGGRVGEGTGVRVSVAVGVIVSVAVATGAVSVGEAVKAFGV